MTSKKCTLCGKTFDEWDEQLDCSVDQLVTYGSKFDEEHIVADLCCDCFDKMVDYAILLREQQLLH